MRKILIVILLLCLFIPIAVFADLTELTKFNVVYQNSKTILSDSPSKTIATDNIMKKEIYPIEISKMTTSFKIIKYRCDEKMQICGYWIEAFRNGKTVATNSPIWISPPPIDAFISESYDKDSDIVTVTLKEDPKLAVEQILQQYVDNQPIGTPVIGTKA